MRLVRASRKTRRALLGSFAWPALLLLPRLGRSATDESVTVERRVKAAFLYKFMGYIAWPDNAFAKPGASLVMGVLGDDALADELAEMVAGRSVEGHALVVKRLRDTDSAAGVHLLFVARSETSHLPVLARSSGAQPLLIVSEAEDALEQGSMINFVINAGRVKFDIAPEAAERRGVKLSSRLLTVARHVRAVTAP
ncbi:MAG: YfiR family protein [Burkholderiaceae bacterium]